MEQAPKPTEAAPPKRKKTWIVVAAVVIIIVVVAGLYFAGYLGGQQGAGTPVSIWENPFNTCSNAQNCGFDPASLPVSVGTKVTWTNNGGQPHTVTTNSTANPPASFDSGSMVGKVSASATGATWSYTFNTAGTYKYYCTIHPWMKAEVVVT